MRTPMLVIAIALATAAAEARAEELVEVGHPAKVDGGYVLDFDSRGLRVRHGKRRAPLTIAGTRPAPHASVEITRRGAAITLGFMPTCWDVTETFTTDQLEARLAHATGVALRPRDLDGAVAELTRAHALDPAFTPAAAELARALIAAGRLDEAAAVLPIADPVARLVAAMIDPSLAPLREHPSMTAARAITPGRLGGGPTGIAITEAGDLVVREALGNHGTCWSEESLRVLDGQTLRERARIPLTTAADFDGDGCDPQRLYTAAGKRRVLARQALADQVLAALGTMPAVGERATVETDWKRHVRKARFDAADLGLVIGADGAARWFRDGTLVSELGPGTAPSAVGGLMVDPDVVLLPDQRRAILQVNQSGCEWTEESIVVAIPAP